MARATIHFECPKCNASNHVSLNIGNLRKKGENNAHCSSCQIPIVISIDVMAIED